MFVTKEQTNKCNRRLISIVGDNNQLYNIHSELISETVKSDFTGRQNNKIHIPTDRRGHQHKRHFLDKSLINHNCGCIIQSSIVRHIPVQCAALYSMEYR